MAAAIRVQARRDAVLHQYLQARPQRRHCALLLDKERRVDLARRIVHRHDQIERRLSLQPFGAAAVLVQHHADARLPLTLLAMTALLPLHANQIGVLQPALHQAVAQRVAVPLHQMLVEVLHIPTLVVAPVQRQHPRDDVRWRRIARRLVQTPVPQGLEPSFLVEPLVAAKLPLRTPQKLGSLRLAQIASPPAVVNTRKLLHPPVLITLGPAHPRPPMLPASRGTGITGQLVCYRTRTTRLLLTRQGGWR